VVRVRLRDRVRIRVTISVRATKYSQSATHFDDPQMQTVDVAMLVGPYSGSLRSVVLVVVGNGRW